METLALVTAASYEFDEESFEDISEQAKDFIRSLLKKDRRCVKTNHPRKDGKITVIVTGAHYLCLEYICVHVRVIHTDKFHLVPYSLQLIMSHSE